MASEMFQDGEDYGEAYELDIVPGVSGLDLSTVTAATIHVLQPDGSETTWTTTLSEQTATTLHLEHAFAGAETDQTGLYRLFAALTVPGGTRRTRPVTMLVKSKYGP